MHKSEPVQQHFVPRTYLRFFASKYEQVYAFDKGNKKSFTPNITGIAQGRYFNRIGESDDRNKWERFFCEEVEAELGKQFSLFTSVSYLTIGQKAIDIEWKKILSKHLCFQLMRTSKAREYQKEISNRTVKEFVNGVRDEFHVELTVQEVAWIDRLVEKRDMVKDAIYGKMTTEKSMKKYSDILIDNKSWYIIHIQNTSKCTFITSDHPVVQYNFRLRSTRLGANGLARSDTILYYPISPKCCLALYPNEMYFSAIMENSDKSSYADDVFVKNVNRLQYDNCHRQVYFNPALTLEDVGLDQFV